MWLAGSRGSEWDGLSIALDVTAIKCRLSLTVRATLLNILKWASCGLYKKSGLGEMRLMV